MVPRLRFPEFVINDAIDFEPGDVIFEPINNKNHNSDLPILAITQEYGAIPRDQIDYNVSVTDKSLESYKVVEIGDFIISLRSFQGGIEYSLYHGICSPAYIILRKRVPIVEQYYKHYFKTSKFIQDLNKDLEGIRDGKMVSYGQFSAIMIPKPDNKEQQKIADCLSSLDELIAAENKKLEALKAHKKGLMQKLFPAEGKTVPQLRFEGYTGAWEQRKLGEIFNTIRNAFVGTATPYYVDKDGHFYLESNNVKDGEINRNKEVFINEEFYMRQKDKWLHEGDLVMVQSGHVGHTAVIPKELNATAAHALIMFQNPKEELNPHFTNYVLQSNTSKKQLDNITKGNIIKHILASDMKEFTIMMTNEPEQTAISAFFLNLDTLMTEQAKKIEALKTHKKGLMQGLFPSIDEVRK